METLMKTGKENCTALDDRIILASSLVEDFLSEVSNCGNTRNAYKNIIVRYLESENISDIQSFAGRAYAEMRTRAIDFIRKFSSASAQRQAYAALKAFFRWLQAVHGAVRSPIPEKLKLPSQRTKSNTESMSFKDVQNLLRKLRDYAHMSYIDGLKYALISVLASTGLRISEALQINVTMVERGMLAVVQKRGRERMLELPHEVQADLLDFIRRYGIEGKLFQTSTKGELDRTYAYRLVKEASGISPHGFRKSVIEILVERGYHSHEVAKVSGHSSISMVFYYDARDTKPTAHKDLAKALYAR